MSKKGYKMSGEHKRKIGLANSIALKGKKQTEATKKKRGETLKKIGAGKWNIGRKANETTKRKMAESHRGEKSHLWKGGITPENKIIRRSIEFRLWREAVFARDNWTCQKCGVKSGNGKAIYLHPHHILNLAEYKELMFAIDNGITLCKKCHEEFHKKFGKRNNTKEQLEEFLR